MDNLAVFPRGLKLLDRFFYFFSFLCIFAGQRFFFNNTARFGGGNGQPVVQRGILGAQVKNLAPALVFVEQAAPGSL